jgi:hypothetical protein
MTLLPLEYILSYSANIINGTAAIGGIADDENPAPLPFKDLPLANFSGLSYILGNCVMSFNLHHSIPSLVTPVQPKQGIKTVFRAVFSTAVFGLALMCTLGMMAFGNAPDSTCQGSMGGCTDGSSCAARTCDDSSECTPHNFDFYPPCVIQELFSMNFVSYHTKFLGEAIGFYPVVIISIYPLLAITLRNNLKMALARGPLELLGFTVIDFASLGAYQDVSMSVLASAPMIGVAYAKPDLQMVTSVSGTYFGICLVYVIPAFLVMAVRKEVGKHSRLGDNPHASEFKHDGWAALVVSWAAICIIATTALLSLEAAHVRL